MTNTLCLAVFVDGLATVRRQLGWSGCACSGIRGWGICLRLVAWLDLTPQEAIRRLSPDGVSLSPGRSALASLAHMVPEEGGDAEEDLNLKLVVLGANGYRPNDLGHTACYAIPELGIMLDAGTGMYRMADYLQTAQIDVYLSHAHPDHTWGLTQLEFMFWRGMVQDALVRDGKVNLASIFRSLQESPPKVRVHAVEEHLQNVEYLVRKFRDRSLIDYVRLQDAEQLPGAGTLRSFPLQHRRNEQCFGFRLDWPGRSLAYVTDTYGEPGAGYAEEIRAADLLLHECYMPDDEPDIARQIGHSHITPVARLAAEAGVGRLVLVHLSPFRPEACEPDLDRAHSIFPGTEVAFDGMEIEF